MQTQSHQRIQPTTSTFVGGIKCARDGKSETAKGSQSKWICVEVNNISTKPSQGFDFVGIAG